MRLGSRRTSRPAASAVQHCTSGSASCTWVCSNCQMEAHGSGRCEDPQRRLTSAGTTEQISFQGSFPNSMSFSSGGSVR